MTQDEKITLLNRMLTDIHILDTEIKEQCNKITSYDDNEYVTNQEFETLKEFLLEQRKLRRSYKNLVTTL